MIIYKRELIIKLNFIKFIFAIIYSLKLNQLIYKILVYKTKISIKLDFS